MKKLLVIMLAFSLVFAAGCGKKDETAADNSQTQVEQQGSAGTQDEAGKEEHNNKQQSKQEQNNEQQSKEEQNNEQQSKEEQNDVDVSDVTGDELTELVETFNSETASEEEKEAARIKLEAIFKQAEQNNPQ